MAYQAMVLHGVVCKDRYHSIYRYCYGKIIRKQTIVQHNVKPRTTKVTILSWFGAKSRLKTFAVSIDTAIRRWANVYLLILANDNLQTCSHVDWQLYFYDILFGQIRQWKNLIEIVSIDTTVLKAFTFFTCCRLIFNIDKRTYKWSGSYIYCIITYCLLCFGRMVLYSMTMVKERHSLKDNDFVRRSVFKANSIYRYCYDIYASSDSSLRCGCCPNLFSSSSILVVAGLSMLIANLSKKKCIAPCL